MKRGDDAEGCSVFWEAGHTGCKWSVGKWKLERPGRVICAMLGEMLLGRTGGWSGLPLERSFCGSVGKDGRGQAGGPDPSRDCYGGAE